MFDASVKPFRPDRTGHVLLLEASSYRHFRGRIPPRFAHPSERTLAHLLDEVGVPWLYEPHTFTLERAEGGAVVEAFTPDFFLPDVGIYVELTTTRRHLMHRKRRKVRKARERHPIVVVLHGREDFERLCRLYVACDARGRSTS
jgi:hypothetical protein